MNKESQLERVINWPLVIAHGEAILENNKRELRAIDKLYSPRKGANGTGKRRPDKTRRAPDTIYDKAQTNPVLATMLREMSRAGL